jgi:hypothetical protein
MCTKGGRILPLLVRLLYVGWTLSFGLTPRPLTERSALACTVIAAGSSGLYGLGLNSTGLQVVRLLFHFLAYSLGAVAIIRSFHAKRVHSHTSVKAAADDPRKELGHEAK